MKILAFAATNHKDSINKKLINCAVDLLKENIAPNAKTETLDLINYEIPLYRQDREKDNGIPEQAKDFYQKISSTDALIIAFAEHNGSYTAVYKNLFDWLSRINQKVYQDKPMIIMATSPGARGGANVLEATEMAAPFFGMNIKGKISVPTFQDHYDFKTGKIINIEIQNQIIQTLKALK